MPLERSRPLDSADTRRRIKAARALAGFAAANAPRSPIGEAIRLRRLDLGLRQDDLAARVERELRLSRPAATFHWPNVSRWERGVSTPRGDRLEAVARALECTVGDLLGARPSQAELQVREVMALLRSIDRRLRHVEALLAAQGTAVTAPGREG